MTDAQFWMALFITSGTIVSLILHHSHNAKLKAIGDMIDKLDGKAGQ